MPEVAEVALTAEILYHKLKGKELSKIQFIKGRYGPGRTPPDGYIKNRKLLPMKVHNIDSRGKFMWFDLVDNENNHLYIWNTYGLSGMWGFEERKYLKTVFSFSNGTKIYFSDMRNFGTFKFSTSKSDLAKKLKSLSPDFLKDSDFDMDRIKKYKKPIVAILMDQKLIGSGLGNYLTAEILYRACISPHRLGSSLTDEDLDLLEFWIKYMVKLSYVDNHIGYMIGIEKEASKIKRKNYHPDIKLGEEEFTFMVYRQKVDPFGNKVKADSIIKGRTTYWVPAVQS